MTTSALGRFLVFSTTAAVLIGACIREKDAAPTMQTDEAMAGRQCEELGESECLARGCFANSIAGRAGRCGGKALSQLFRVRLRKPERSRMPKHRVFQRFCRKGYI